MFGLLLGASGGPKWLVLSHIDRVLARRLIGGRTRLLRLLGSSIGAWRHSCLARRDPATAIELFEKLYIGQHYDDGPPTAARVSAVSLALGRELFGPLGVEEILGPGKLETYIISVRSRGPVATESPWALRLGLAVAALSNAASRKTLSYFFERVVFGPKDSRLSFGSLATRHCRLSAGNFEQVLLASGSIPLVMSAVSDIGGAPAGLYRDGGITDYNFDFDFDFDHGNGLVLFPHFFDRITPGWFDKALAWRRPSAEALSRVLMVAPSAEFIAGLPGARVPDRGDFMRYPTEQRFGIWREVTDRCRRLGDELEQLIDDGRIGARIEAFTD